MENLKIKVNNEAEGREAQELFFEAGCSWGGVYGTCVKTLKFPRFIAYSGKFILSDCIEHNFNFNNAKEITIQQLKDLVILKRNSIDDATHENNHNQKLYKAENGWYIYIESHNAWMWNQEELGYKPIKLKPIEKPMKEYLNKETHEFIRSHSELNDMWIEIPEGAELYTKYDNNNEFYKSKNGVIYRFNECCWVETNWGSISQILEQCKKFDFPVFWKKENNQTIASAVESLNDKAKSAEDFRQEQKLVNETLAERQSTYGDFSKVAEMTQGLLFVMSQYGYSDMPDTHKESIHMIASKLARIVNGDNNHLDSWHDIGGYSKLIENLINEHENEL